MYSCMCNIDGWCQGLFRCTIVSHRGVYGTIWSAQYRRYDNHHHDLRLECTSLDESLGDGASSNIAPAMAN